MSPAPSRTGRRRRVLFAAAEVFPLVKTGGLADVAACLPQALRELGVDVRVIMPAYRGVLARRDWRVVADLPVAPGVRLRAGRLDGGVPLYLVDAPDCFDRDGNPYLGPDGADWPDNARRFGLYCRAVAAIADGSAGLAWRPDVLHANDWHTGLALALLDARAGRPRTLFTIHNLAYQGLFPRADFDTLGLPPRLWAMDGVEYYGQLSFMKAALQFADRLTTVSPRYAAEILTHEYGHGLDPLLVHRRDALTGIVNGVDYRLWDPRHDPHLPEPYWHDRPAGKQAAKAHVQSALGLAVSREACLFGHIGRMAEQKGTDLLLAALPALLADPRAQLVVLGSGPARYEQAFAAAARAWPGRVAAVCGYDEALAHRIEAASDAFLMPSRFEPCGLNQLYSLRYGAVPIVRATGGLADTVVDTTPATLADGTATGFLFADATAGALAAAAARALALRADAAAWSRLVATGMERDWSWTASARQYQALYG